MWQKPNTKLTAKNKPEWADEISFSIENVEIKLFLLRYVESNEYPNLDFHEKISFPPMNFHYLFSDRFFCFCCFIYLSRAHFSMCEFYTISKINSS